MGLTLQHAALADAERIATIHLAAFGDNSLLHAQFPTPASLSALHAILAAETRHAIEHAKQCKAILIVKDTGLQDDQTISFAKWDLPTDVKQVLHEKVTWPEDCQQQWLDRYHELAEAAKERVLGNSKCYRKCSSSRGFNLYFTFKITPNAGLTFVGTDPRHRGRGAGSMLTKWGLSAAEKVGKPVYLESTITACSLYRRLGFVPRDGFSLRLPENHLIREPNIYEEVCMVKLWHESKYDNWDSNLGVAHLTRDFASGVLPQTVVQAVYDRIDTYKKVQPSVWLHLEPIGEVMRAASALHTRFRDKNNRPPLWGVPFSVKDSIDVAGLPTTTGCPPLISIPTVSAPVFQRCIDAGALFIGKTNMEQLATGMTGCRSPYGTLHSTFSKSHIVGGSSSGSAVTVGQKLVAFSIGSDTAGSIRVPALFNGIVGFKPTKGTVSARGVSPASLHQDCVSFLTTSTGDAERVWNVCKGFDAGDVFAKLPWQTRPAMRSSQRLQFRFGIPPEHALEVCSLAYRREFDSVVRAIEKSGGKFLELDWTPFEAANDLLYNSTFVLERLTMFPDGWLERNKQLLHPVTRQVLEGIAARQSTSTAVDVFKDLHKQAEYKRAVENILTVNENIEEGVDEITLMIVPTAPFHPTIDEVDEDPVAINGKLGAFAHFANVLDLVGLATPCGRYRTGEVVDGKAVELPFGVTILAGVGLDAQVFKVVREFLRDVVGESKV